MVHGVVVGALILGTVAFARADAHTTSTPLSDSTASSAPATTPSASLPKQITVKHDNRRTTFMTTASTVGEVLHVAGIDLGPHDLVDTSGRTPLVDGTVITVTRVGIKHVMVSYAIPFRVVNRHDARLYTGVTRTIRRGRVGRGVATYRVVRHDGLVVRRALVERKVRTAPRAAIRLVGTKARPVPTVASAAGLNWAALAQCESGGDPRAVNPAGYYGLYQFTLGTWASVGGVGNPIDATSDEQTYRAQLLFTRSGAAPWPVCGPQLFS